MSALGTFWPVFKGGQNLPSILLAILLTLGFTVIVSYGVETTALLDLIGTLAKLVPLLIFTIVTALAFHWSTFVNNFWGAVAQSSRPILAVADQVKNSIMVMMWLFMGVESASVMAHRAKRQRDAVVASFGGWLILLVVYLLISLLPYGVMTRAVGWGSATGNGYDSQSAGWTLGRGSDQSGLAHFGAGGLAFVDNAAGGGVFDDD